MENILHSCTFPVSDVTPATKPLPVIRSQEAIAQVLGPIEACSKTCDYLVRNVGSHPLIAALHAAFSTHAPICLSPDIIWLTITQGLATHINQNAEELRSRFVAHEGKLKIRIERDDFVKGSPDNDWPGVFTEFSQAIRKHIGDSHDLIVGDFSTTGPVERAAFEVVLLDSMQAYFDYEICTVCGIPSITLEGTPDDWRSIVSRLERFRDFGLDWWVTPLLPVLEQFVLASEGHADRDFWNSIYKWKGPDGSGTPVVSGWILKLFPYLRYPRDFKRNPWLEKETTRHFGPDRACFPRLPAMAPFKWLYDSDTFDMEFIGGFMGVSQDPTTLTLRPEIGWAIRNARTDDTRVVIDFDGPDGIWMECY